MTNRAFHRLALSLAALATWTGFALAEPVPLALDDAIKLALQRNQQIKVNAFGRSIAKADVLTALGRFDPALSFRRNYTEDGAPASSNPLVAQVTQTDDASLALEGVSPWGLRYSLGGSMENARGTYNRFTDTYATFGGVTVTQPLLKGFGFGANLQTYRVAKADRAIADWEFRQTLIDTVTAVIGAYSDLVYAQKALQIAEISRALAAGLVEENEKRFRVGSISESDITQARARTARREQSVIIARQDVHDATNQLRQLIGETEFSITPEGFVVAATPPASIHVDAGADLKTALAQRPDFQAAKLGIVKRQAVDAAARNRLLPQVDFVGSYGYNGLDRDFSASRRMVRESDNRSYTAGVVVSVPLTFAEGRGQARSARLQLRQAEADLTRIEQDIAIAVAQAAGQIETTRQRVEANRKAYDLAKQALDAELKKLRAGTSSTFFVLNLQEELTYADLTHEASLAAQRRAHAAYERVLARTLATYGIALEP